MKHLPFFQRCAAFLIDCTVAVFIFNIVAWVISYFYFVPFLPGFFIIWLLYYVISFCICGQTFGLAFFNGRMVSSAGGSPSWLRILFREGFTSFPAVVLWLACFSNFSPIYIWELDKLYLKFFKLLFLIVICILATRKQRVFKILIIKDETAIPIVRLLLYKKRFIGSYLILIVVATAARLTNTVATNTPDFYNNEQMFVTPRPTSHSVKKYVDYLQQNRQDINNYVLELFKTYDHVILCERIHPEMTQYDMIYNLVTDERFVDNVGTLFTEIGSAESRDAYKTFVDTSFSNDTIVEKELAAFMMENQTVHLLWTRTNWFNFLKKMYYFNHGKDNPVNIFFTDKDWIDKSLIYTRDSLMAESIISTIKSDSLKKSLTIMNYRHAYLTPGNCGYYLEQAYPGKVANVMINTASVFYGFGMMFPIHHGKWDVAFEQMPEEGFAFNFDGSPFGKDRFDHFLYWSPLNKKHYQDMFTGLIYYQPLSKHYTSNGFNHMFDSENLKKLTDRALLLGDNIENLNNLKSGLSIERGKQMYFKQNPLDNIGYFLSCLLAIFILCGMSVTYFYQKKKTANY